MQVTIPRPSPQSPIPPPVVIAAPSIPGRPAWMGARGVVPSGGFVPVVPSPGLPTGALGPGYVLAMPPVPSGGLPVAVGPGGGGSGPVGGGGLSGWPGLGTGSGAGALPGPAMCPPLKPPGDLGPPTVGAVPEPASVMMLGIGAAIVAATGLGRRFFQRPKESTT